VSRASGGCDCFCYFFILCTFFYNGDETEPSETKRKGTDSRAVEAKRWIRPSNGAWRVDAGDDAK